MKKLLIALSISLLCQFPAQAQFNNLAQQAQTVFMQTYSVQGLINVNSNPDHGLSFADGTSQANIDAVTAAALTYDWTGATIKNPDIKGFYTAIATDQNLPTAAQTQLPLTQKLMEDNIANPIIMNNYVANMYSSGVNPWMTADVIIEIYTLAQKYNIPLVPPVVASTTPNLTNFKLTCLGDLNLPASVKLKLLGYSAALSDLFGYVSVKNAAEPLASAVTAGVNVVIPLTALDSNMLPGTTFVVISDGTNLDIALITAITAASTVTNPDQSTTTTPASITVSGIAHNYDTTAYARAANTLQNSWLSIINTDPAIIGVKCADGVTLASDRVQANAHTNGFDLVPTN